MPTYQYACTECGHDFEQVQAFSDDSLTECPVCQGRLRKVFNAVGVVFKGSGFYRNDSRASSASESGSSSDSSPDKPSDTPKDKPAEKSGSVADKPSEKSTSPAATTATSASDKAS